MKEEYPYFIYPAVIALRQGVDDPEQEKRLRRIVAANVGDIPALRIMLGLDPEEFASFYPDLALPELSTNDTISSFLSRFGSADAPLPPAAAEIDSILPSVAAGTDATLPPVDTPDSIPISATAGSPSQDTISILKADGLIPPPEAAASSSSATVSSHSSSVDTSALSSHFGERKTVGSVVSIGDNTHVETHGPESGEKPEDRPITEQTARILIKNRDYQGALEIIQQLSLNIPEKSIYFADQIRFLKKLILNEAYKNV